MANDMADMSIAGYILKPVNFKDVKNTLERLRVSTQATSTKAANTSNDYNNSSSSKGSDAVKELTAISPH